MNKIIIQGRVTATPESLSQKNGDPYVKFGIADNYFHKTTNSKKCNFFNCFLRHNLDIFNKYVSKGSQLIIFGQVTLSDKEGFKNQPSISVSDFYFCGDKKNSDSDTRKQSETDDLPF